MAEDPKRDVPTFRGIDGLRAWLAVAVVFSHLLAMAGYGGGTAAGRLLGQLANLSVDLFIIISGFVICHMRIVKPKSYGLYVGRRALRIFPVYLAALLLALPTPLMLHQALGAVGWSDPVEARFAAVEAAGLRPPALWWHLAAHLTLLHGAIPNGVLAQSQFQFVSPAWSLSLEWQFYLLAPFWIALARAGRAGAAAAALLAAGAWVLFERGRFGSFTLPSLVFGGAPLFAVGILTRLALGEPRRRALRIGGVLAPYLAVCLLAGAVIGSGHRWNLLLAASVWFVFIVANLSETARRLGLLRPFESRPMLAAGMRSYVVYIVHWPVLAICTWVAIVRLGLGQRGTLLLDLAVGVALVALAAEWLHHTVESPAIGFGRRLGRPRAAVRSALASWDAAAGRSDG